MPRQKFRIDPIPGRGFIVDAAEHGALEVSMTSVIARKSAASVNLAGVISCLKSLIGLAPEKEAVPVRPTKPVLLLFYEDPAALPALRKLARGVPGREVKLQAAALLLLDPGGMSSLQQSLLRGRIDECMLIAASSDGASPLLSKAMQKLGRAMKAPNVFAKPIWGRMDG